MADRFNDTEMGRRSGRPLFDTTQWTEIFSVRRSDPAGKEQAIGSILECYWAPVYSYLRRKGSDNDRAKDLTQAFFTRILEKGTSNLLHKADPTKGRFRTLLLTSLDNFVRDEHRKATAAKRRPEGGWVSLEADSRAHWEPADQSDDPQGAFHRVWATRLLEEVLQQLESACIAEGKQTHWSIFHDRFLDPILTGSIPPRLGELCQKYELSGEKQVSNMAVTVKRRFAAAIRLRVSQWVSDEEEIDEEIMDLMKILH